MPTDQELIQAIQAGSAEAFDELYERYYAPLTAYLLKIVHHAAAADDLAQETFLKVWTHADQLSGVALFKAWLYRVATNQAFNTLRDASRHAEQPLADPDEALTDDPDAAGSPVFRGRTAWFTDTSALDPDAAYEQNEQERVLSRLIDQLPEEKRQVFDMVSRLEMSIKTVAETLGIPEGTVKSRLHYARSWLSQEWQALDLE